MGAYLTTNLIITCVCVLALMLLSYAPARLRLYVTLVLLASWLVPWPLIQFSPLPYSVPAIDIPDLPLLPLELMTWSSDLASQSSIHSTFNLVPDVRPGHWLLVVFSIAFGLLLLDIRGYRRLLRTWRANSTLRNDLWQLAGFESNLCDIRTVQNTGPGMATGLYRPTIWLDAREQNAATIRLTIYPQAS